MASDTLAARPEQLVFIIGSPRSGTTLLQRMLGSHSAVYTHPEPHLITPLAYLGYYQTVDKAPFDHINAAEALREFCQELPRGEEDYLDALRAYATTLYGRVLAPSGKGLFLDKTPAYALVLPFLLKLFPTARYVVLTRHPLAILHSVAHSFFAGDYAAAQTATAGNRPILTDYVPAIARLLAERPVPLVHVRYDDLVSDPEQHMRRIATHLELNFEPNMVTYGQAQHITKSYGDPMSVAKHNTPVTDSLNKWAADLAANPQALQIAQRAVENLDPAHLEAWGYPKEALFDPMGDAKPQKTAVSALNSYRLKRKLVLALRKNIQHNALGKALRKTRYYCDVLLRT